MRGAGGSTATWNPSDSLASTLTNGNLTWESSGGSNTNVRAASSLSGKVYWELNIDTSGGKIIGVEDVTESISKYMYSSTLSWGYTALGTKIHQGSDSYPGSAYGSTYLAGDVIGVAFDAATGKLWVAKNNTWQGSGDPAAGTNPMFTLPAGTYKPALGAYTSSGVSTANFGASAFAYTPPSGFSGLS